MYQMFEKGECVMSDEEADKIIKESNENSSKSDNEKNISNIRAKLTQQRIWLAIVHDKCQ